jgi:hypothetical protein
VQSTYDARFCLISFIALPEHKAIELRRMLRLFLITASWAAVLLLTRLLAAAQDDERPGMSDAMEEEERPFVPRHYQDIKPVESDVPFITCSMCKRMVRQLITQVKEPKQGKKKATELDYLDYMKNLCDPLEDEGFWLTHLDVLPANGKLIVKRMNVPGHCQEDCKTVALACQTVVNAADSEMAEMLFLDKSGTSPETICASKIFKSLKGNCANGEPTLPPDWFDKGSAFRHKTKKDFDREQKAAEKLLGIGEDEETTKPKEGIKGMDVNTLKDGMDDVETNVAVLESGADGQQRKTVKDGL